MASKLSCPTHGSTEHKPIPTDPEWLRCTKNKCKNTVHRSNQPRK